MRIYLLFLLISILSGITTTECNAQSEATTGPKEGSLIIAGGGRLGESIINRFIALAGGPDALIVIVPTALGAKSYDENYGGTRAFRDAGATNVTVLHTDDRTEANSDAFVQPLRDAKAVWFGGGRQWRLVDSYKDTKAEELFWQVLDRGGVIGGSSAGATIQGSYLARGDTKNNQIMMGDHEEGFSFIKNIAIDQHVLARNRQFDMFNILRNRPELLGVSIDEGTAMVVQKNQFEVLGDSYVIVYDSSFWSREESDLKTLPPNDKLFYFLREGDQYDLKKRKVISK
ncbi:MAG: cyanophycinase [Bacteroidota bacterium]